MNYKVLLVVILSVFLGWTCTKEELTEEDLGLTESENDFIEVIDYADNTITYDYTRNKNKFIEFKKDRIVLSKSADIVDLLEEGKILMSPYETFNPSYFYVRRILSITEQENRIVLSVEPAKIEEAMDELNYRVNASDILRSQKKEVDLIDFTFPGSFSFQDMPLSDMSEEEVEKLIEPMTGLSQLCNLGELSGGLRMKASFTYVHKVDPVDTNKTLQIGLENFETQVQLFIKGGIDAKCKFPIVPEITIPLPAGFKLNVDPFVEVGVKLQGSIEASSKSKESILFEYDESDIPTFLPSSAENRTNNSSTFGFIGTVGGEICAGTNISLGIGAEGGDFDLFFGLECELTHCGGFEATSEFIIGEDVSNSTNCFTEFKIVPTGNLRIVVPGRLEYKRSVTFLSQSWKDNNEPCSNDITYDPCTLGITGEDSFFIDCENPNSDENRSSYVYRIHGQLKSEDQEAQLFNLYVNDVKIANQNGDDNFMYNQDISGLINQVITNDVTIKIEDVVKSDNCSRYFTIAFEEIRFEQCSQDCITDDVIEGTNYTKIFIGSNSWMGDNLSESSVNSISGAQFGPQYFNINQLFDTNDDLSSQSFEQLKKLESKRGLCPEGYHVPSLEEWITLLDFADWDVNKLVRSSAWNIQNTDVVPLGFCVSPAGFVEDGKLWNSDSEAVFWTSSAVPNEEGNFFSPINWKEILERILTKFNILVDV